MRLAQSGAEGPAGSRVVLRSVSPPPGRAAAALPFPWAAGAAPSMRFRLGPQETDYPVLQIQIICLDGI